MNMNVGDHLRFVRLQGLERKNQLEKAVTLFQRMYLCVVGVHFNCNTVVSCVFKGAGPRNQRAESETSGAEWQKGT